MWTYIDIQADTLALGSRVDVDEVHLNMESFGNLRLTYIRQVVTSLYSEM